MEHVAQDVFYLYYFNVCIEPTKDAVWQMLMTIAIVGFLALCVVVVSVTVVVVVLRKHQRTTPGNLSSILSTRNKIQGDTNFAKNSCN